jgi:hypothetical protein
MLKISAGLLLIALTTLMMELTLIRVFDVIWYTNMAYMVITLAMFCFGLSGVYSSLRPIQPGTDIRRFLTVLAVLFALFSITILPVMNYLPFDFNLIYDDPLRGIAYFQVMYLVLAIPFFLSGLIFTTVFSSYAKKIQSLYFWDLAGAAVGCVILVPLLPKIGPGGLLFLACGFGLWASALFSNKWQWSLTALLLGAAIIIVPFIQSSGYFEFREHIVKRGVKRDRERGKVELTYWDPISKIDVIDWGPRKHIAYDGGSQSSFIFPFNGNFDKLRNSLPEAIGDHFTGHRILISHHLKQDSNQKVLIIGAAGGQETKAALTYGAAWVDGVELVDFVVQLGKKKYADYNGNIFNHPKANIITGEGRSFLRSTDKKYDIIQIFSNHTSSSIAAGTGAMATTYLQTAEAYQEYFNHLAENGILHINHHIYPRMVTTAALAWKQMGRKDFKKHVVVCEVAAHMQDNLPTLLIKMSPWTQTELDLIDNFFPDILQIVENPLDYEKSFLSEAFYTGKLPQDLVDRMKFRVQACTDDRPYFNFLRKTNKMVLLDKKNFMNYSTAALLDSQLKKGVIPTDTIHLIVTGSASLLFTALFILVPLFFSKAGKTKWPNKKNTLIYFGCLGAGFIIIELVFIQLFMKLIGYPLYTYSTVVFALLLAAGAGSYMSGKIKISPQNRWAWPFYGVLLVGTLLIGSHNFIFNFFLTASTPIRILVSTILIFPLGFFLGMPFPLGILAIEKQPAGAIAWAWGLNGLFTVIGGFLSVVLSIYIGFKATIWIALGIYCIAFFMYAKIRTIRGSS